MNQWIKLFKTLSDETRLRILVLLYHRKLCVCQLQGVLQESQPKISKHLAKLRDMGYVKDERKEQFIFYYLDHNNEQLINLVEEIVMDIQEDLILAADINRLEQAETFIQAKRME